MQPNEHLGETAEQPARLEASADTAGGETTFHEDIDAMFAYLATEVTNEGS